MPHPISDDAQKVLNHIIRRQCSHPESPATGLHGMSDSCWKECIQELRDTGYDIHTTVCAGGDRAANETGYTLTADEATLALAGQRLPDLDRAVVVVDETSLISTKSTESSYGKNLAAAYRDLFAMACTDR